MIYWDITSATKCSWRLLTVFPAVSARMIPSPVWQGFIGILLNDFREIGNAVHIAESVEAELTATSMIKGYNRMIPVSIGITVFSSRYQNPNEMLRDADSAMYRQNPRAGRITPFLTIPCMPAR